ncbi:VOC family protein [Bradyrhizobium pachyrhizi]|uniref:VOC family protein n=1 Tax=Bradyrhizobium pachyrhizi TaxID=280333 RepID=UPI0024B140A7|nr:VOC family protein [Bradyrhizobium pachyrhizi]WFU55195.1 VOC family protein [Bradyrhizobium pachyrhizi]
MRLKQVYLTAADPQDLARFYEALGLSVRFADAGRWIQFVSDTSAFCIAGPSESASDQSRGAVPVFEVDDLEATVASAQAAGGKAIGAIRDMGSHGRVAHIRDPRGNDIQFFQPARS